MDPKAPALIHILLSTPRQGRNSPYRAGRHELGALTSFISFISFASFRSFRRVRLRPQPFRYPLPFAFSLKVGAASSFGFDP